MSKIRINELARQLEVKSREVIDKLHELGIAEKVTHSSSIDEDMADRLRRYYAGDTSAAAESSASRNGSAVAVEESPVSSTETAERPQRRESPARQLRAVGEGEAPAHEGRTGSEQRTGDEAAGSAEDQGAESGDAEQTAEKGDDDRPRAIPLRPPLLGRSAPIQPPLGNRPVAMPLRTASPSHPAPSQPAPSHPAPSHPAPPPA